MKVFVTGASGLVGLNLVKHLASSGVRTTALIRSTSRKETLEHIRQQYPKHVEIITGELFDTNSLASLMLGHEVVVHAAAIIEPYADASLRRIAQWVDERRSWVSAVAAYVQSSLSSVSREEDVATGAGLQLGIAVVETTVKRSPEITRQLDDGVGR